MGVQTVGGNAQANVGLGMSNRLWKLLDFYIQWHDVEGHTPRTQRTYRIELSQFFTFLEGRGHSMDATEVTSLDVLAHLQDMKTRGLRPRTLLTRRVSLLAFFNWAEDWEVIPQNANPCSRIKPPKVPKDYKPFLSPEAFTSMQALCPLNTFVGARRSSMLWLLVSTGIRRHELLSLKVSDVDWDNKTVRINLGKGQKTRTIPFIRQTRAALLRYMAQRL